MSRDKDTALAVRCRMMADASTDALAWFAANEKFVGNRRAGLERGFKKHAVEARKLAQAAERPMSVGVFGASQAGKSFLTGSFISPADRPVHVVFGEGEQRQKLNFLNDVNPVGGDETTGLVTRFSIRPQSVPSNEYPVVLRLLSEADLVKIIANTYTLDLRGRGDKPLTAERVREVFAPLDAALAATALPGLADVDVFDIEQYIQEDLDDHPLNGHDAIREEYWLNLEKTAPYLQPRERAAALSVLWGEIPEFTALFLELKDALDSLGHPETGYAPLSAIRDRAHGILHVATVYGLDLSDGDATARVTIMTPEGRTAALRKPVVTALTAELRVTMDSTPWPFFEHTDLLDFPGARGRESKTAAEFLRGEEAKPTNRAYCFLRGKIAVLFDKYSADLDLNTMLLCADDRNQEVRKLAELVQRWVARTHGRTAQDRAGKRTSMFLCLTKADTLFDQKAGAAPVDMIRTRIEKDIKFYASWTGEWMPGRPFDNTFFVRNPKFMREDLFDYEPIPPGADEGYVPAEIRLRDTQLARLEDFTKVFAGIDVVRDHVARPEDKLSAVLEVNDGGITYLADALAPTCDPDQKYDQVLPRADGLTQRMARELAPFHEAGDVAERVAERAGRARAVMRVFARHPHLIGRFMAEISADEASLGGLYMKTARGGLPRGEDAPAGPAPATGSGGIILDGLFDDEDDGTESDG